MRNAAILVVVLATITQVVSSSNYTQDASNLSYVALNLAAYGLENFTLGNSTAYALVSGDKIHAFFVSAYRPGESSVFLTDLDEIKSSLDAYYRSKGYSPGEINELASIHAEIQGLSHTQDSGEAECRKLAGTDHYPCESFDSCRLACFASPFCPNFIYGGAPGEFVYVLWNFENSSRELKDAYLEENDSFAALTRNSSLASTRDYLSSVDRINLATTKVNFDPLFAYSFCFKPDYSLSNLTKLQLSVQRNLENAPLFFSIPEEAEKIRNRTLELLERQKKTSQLKSEENSTNQSVKLPKPALKVANQSIQPPLKSEPEKPALATGNIAVDTSALVALAAIDGLGLLLLAAAIAINIIRKKVMKKDKQHRGGAR